MIKKGWERNCEVKCCCGWRLVKLHEHVFRWKHATAVKVFKLFSVGVVKLLWVSREMSVNYVYLCEVDHYI